MINAIAITNVTALQFSDILPNVAEQSGDFSFDETDAGEQEIIALTITRRTVINALWLDMSNLTQDVTLRVYHQIDGSNYREFQENSWKTTFDDGVLIPGFVANGNIRLTIQCSGAGAGLVDIPYTVM